MSLTDDLERQKEELKINLELLAERDSHNAEVSINKEANGFRVHYDRGVDQALVDKITALPTEVREENRWIGESYMETLAAYTHPMSLAVTLPATTITAEDAPTIYRFAMLFGCRMPVGLDNQGCMQLGVSLGQCSEDDPLSAPSITAVLGTLTINLFYRSEQPQLDQQFAERIYQAFKTVYDAVSIPADLNRRVDAVMNAAD